MLSSKFFAAIAATVLVAAAPAFAGSKHDAKSAASKPAIAGLYQADCSSATAPRIVAKELGMDIPMHKVDLMTHTVASTKEDFYKTNPTGMVPAATLEGGRLLTESAVISQYIADMDASARLLPKTDTLERYLVLEQTNYISTEIHKTIAAIMQGKSDKKIFTEKLAKNFKVLDARLAGHEYLANEKLSIADFHLATFVMAAKHYMKMDFSGMKNIEAHYAKISAMPSFKDVISAEGCDKPMPAAEKPAKKGKKKN